MKLVRHVSIHFYVSYVFTLNGLLSIYCNGHLRNYIVSRSGDDERYSKFWENPFDKQGDAYRKTTTTTTTTTIATTTASTIKDQIHAIRQKLKSTDTLVSRISRTGRREKDDYHNIPTRYWKEYAMVSLWKGQAKDRPQTSSSINLLLRNKNNDHLRLAPVSRWSELRNRLAIQSIGRQLRATGLSACEQSVTQEETNGKAFGTKCQCVTNTQDGSVQLECQDLGCYYCNDNLSVCEHYSYGVHFDPSGTAISYVENNQYISGLSGNLVYTEDYNTCTVSFNNAPCTELNQQRQRIFPLHISRIEWSHSFPTCNGSHFYGTKRPRTAKILELSSLDHIQ